MNWPISIAGLTAIAIGVVVALGVAGTFDSGEPEATPDGREGESLAIEAAIEAAIVKMEEMGAYRGNIVILDVRAVDWPDSCLGVEQEGALCAEVITPGFVVVLTDISEYVFHTDRNGHAVLAGPAE